MAFFSVIDSCRNHPIKFRILYHNSPATKSTRETQIFHSDQNNHYSYRLSTNEQLLYQYSNNDSYYNLLLVEAERFFNEKVKELTHVCIGRLAEVCISASMSSHLDRKSHLNSEDVSSLQTYETEKKDPLQ